MRVHTIPLAALVLAASLSLAACSGDGGDSADGASAPAASSTPSPADSSGSGGSQQDGGTASPEKTTTGSEQGGSNESAGSTDQTAPTGSSGSGKPGRCGTDDLKITASNTTIDGDPTPSVTVTLKNSGGRDCTIYGYAGVNLNTSGGSVPAERSGQKSTSAVLKSGKSTFFPITYPANKTGGSGVRITGLVVTPPDETKSVTLSWPGESTLPATNGSGTPVKIGPVGSAGQAN
ncbi:DUF4232 domain-containing protein [Streptomyces sp. CA-111067]|uniref:DUF4232 domain-containing protein n=1 Tax=Streptomyces sp. CA-111067 TaxID=3240046 RepID=UPI003D962AC9